MFPPQKPPRSRKPVSSPSHTPPEHPSKPANPHPRPSTQQKSLDKPCVPCWHLPEERKPAPDLTGTKGRRCPSPRIHGDRERAEIQPPLFAHPSVSGRPLLEDKWVQRLCR